MVRRLFRGSARRLVAVAAVLALLPAVALAQAPAAIAEVAPTASVEGIVSSVAGSTVGILEDLVKIDISNAAGNGSSAGGSVRPPEPGDRIVASVKVVPSGGVLVAERFVVLEQHPGSIRGLIETVDAAAKTITVLGLAIHLDANTSIGGLPTDNIPTIADLRVGQNVVADLEARSGQLFAKRILVLNPNPVNEIRFEGAVKSIGAEAWVFTVSPSPAAGLATTRELTVKVTAQTRIVGDPRVGDRAFVVAQIQSDGSFVAISIEKRVTPPQDVFRVVGTVKNIQGDLWTIGIVCPTGQVCPAIADTVVRVDARTELKGDPRLGDYVLAEAEITDGGAGIPHARSIQKLTPDQPGTVRLSGNVKSIASDKWIITFPSFTTPAVEATLLVGADTKIEGGPRVGDQVRVEAVPTSAPLTYRALKITKVGDTPSNKVSFNGFVRKIEGDRWTIGISPIPTSEAAEYTVRTTRETQIVGNPRAGDAVHVEAQRPSNAAGELIALLIQKVDVIALARTP